MACKGNGNPPAEPGPRPSAPGATASGAPHARRRRRKRIGFARFFTKQLLLFAACALLIIMVDFFLYAAIAYRESDANFNDGTPATVTRAVDAALAPDAGGAYALGGEGAAELAAHGAWGMLVGADGAVIWSQNLPSDVPTSYAPNDIAMAAHYAAIADYPAFFWDRDDGLLVVGFPKGEFWTAIFTYPASTMRNLPLYVLLIFAVDVAMLFLLYAVSRRRTQNAVGPIADALDKLSEGRAAEVHLKGDLREIGQQITETSGIIEQKDAARANWIRGVSHDIRTPLSMILGYTDGIAQDDGAPEDVRAQAAVIRAQGLRIKDLVTDLNTASQLDYTMQPLHLERVHLPRLLRGIVAAHANSGLDDMHPIELDVEEGAADAVVLGDERLLTRAVENAVANARLHNEQGCTIQVSLHVEKGPGSEGPRAVVRIADDGAGATPEELAALEARLARARTSRSAAGSYGEEHNLGLVLVDRIAREHRGGLALEAASGEGFAVALALPLA